MEDLVDLESRLRVVDGVSHEHSYNRNPIKGKGRIATMQSSPRRRREGPYLGGPPFENCLDRYDPALFPPLAARLA